MELEYEEELRVNLTIEINGEPIPIDACVDTGFTGVADVRIPLAHMELATELDSTTSTDSNGIDSIAWMTLEGRLTSINGQEVNESLTTIFQDGDPLLGLPFLKKHILHLDGPSQIAILSLTNRNGTAEETN